MIHLSQVLQTIPPGVGLVAVSKYKPASLIQEAYAQGQRVFGESRALELRDKYEGLPKDIEWHFIGHLQRNKVKYIAPFVSLIHAVDSFSLLEEIDRQAARFGRVIPCLLELHVAQEETKSGFTPSECIALVAEGKWKNLRHVELAGLMCMATYTDNQDQIAAEFDTALQTFQLLKSRFFASTPTFRHRSWGMSGDYLIALQHGATLVRIGTAIFGER